MPSSLQATVESVGSVIGLLHMPRKKHGQHSFRRNFGRRDMRSGYALSSPRALNGGLAVGRVVRLEMGKETRQFSLQSKFQGRDSAGKGEIVEQRRRIALTFQPW